MSEHPEFRRVSYADHAHTAARSIVPDDPDRAAYTAMEACRLSPLQKIQVELDQFVRLAESHARGEPWEHAGAGFAGYVRAAAAHMGRLRDVLRCAHEASESMLGTMANQLSDLEDAMSKQKKDADGSAAPDAPQLTASGDPHPLQEGGYDADADPQLPGNISDVEALKEGKTTHKQAEAIGRSDAMHDEGQEPDRADGLDAVDDDDDTDALDDAADEPDRPKKTRAKKPKK